MIRATAGIVPMWRGSMPLEWQALCDHVRRPSLPEWRGEMPLNARSEISLSAPTAVAACAQFRLPQRFPTEALAETFRAVSPRAQQVVRLWFDARYAREAVREAIHRIRALEHYKQHDEAAQRRADLRDHCSVLAKYRRGQRRLADRIEAVRLNLTPRPAAVLLAAE